MKKSRRQPVQMRKEERKMSKILGFDIGGSSVKYAVMDQMSAELIKAETFLRIVNTMDPRKKREPSLLAL